MQPIYLDNNSTTAIDPKVADAMAQCQAAGFVNPASQHQMGQQARRYLEEIRVDLLTMLGGNAEGMQPDQFVFTSGGTESNNLALIGLSLAKDGSIPQFGRVLISAVEHPSITATADYLKTRGFTVERISVDSNGVLNLDDLDVKLSEPARLVSVMLANNETGVIQPIAEIAKTCKERGAVFHTDAVQGVGKVPVDFSALGVDALTLTAHKFHGPKGIGGLILRNSIQPFPQIFGGFQQQGIRPGTEDVCLATGLRAALRIFLDESSNRQHQIAQLRDRLEHQICENCRDVVVNGRLGVRVPQTLNISFPGINRQQLLLAADMNGLAVSTGSACASGSSDPSPVLIAMGLQNDVVEGSIRISLSAFTTTAEIDLAAQRIIRIVNDLRR